MDALHACTIVSKNYLPFARVLARSFLAHHPGSRVFVLLVDRVDGAFEPAEEPFELVPLEALEIPDLGGFVFKYTILELNTAVKPYLLQHLLEREGVERLVYLDPDILVFGRLAPVEGVLGESALVLTPHLTSPLDDDRRPTELDILRSGAYNLGFIALLTGRRRGSFSPGGRPAWPTGAWCGWRRVCSSTRSGSTWCPGCTRGSGSCATPGSTSPTGT